MTLSHYACADLCTFIAALTPTVASTPNPNIIKCGKYFIPGMSGLLAKSRLKNFNLLSLYGGYLPLYPKRSISDKYFFFAGKVILKKVLTKQVLLQGN